MRKKRLQWYGPVCRRMEDHGKVEVREAHCRDRDRIEADRWHWNLTRGCS